MRALLVVNLMLSLAGCTSLLLGTASSGESGVSTDQRSSSQIAADDTISAAIRRKFSADSLVGQYALAIRTHNSDVTLSGTVGSYPARDRAVQIATDTEGARSVRNQIIVNTNL